MSPIAKVRPVIEANVSFNSRSFKARVRRRSSMYGLRPQSRSQGTHDAQGGAKAQGYRRAREAVRGFLEKNGRKLWWLHSVYALALGIGVVAFAQKGFEHARWLAVSLGLAWLLVVVFFRRFGERAAPDAGASQKARVHFFVM